MLKGVTLRNGRALLQLSVLQPMKQTPPPSNTSSALWGRSAPRPSSQTSSLSYGERGSPTARSGVSGKVARGAFRASGEGKDRWCDVKF